MTTCPTCSRALPVRPGETLILTCEDQDAVERVAGHVAGLPHDTGVSFLILHAGVLPYLHLSDEALAKLVREVDGETSVADAVRLLKEGFWVCRKPKSASHESQIQPSKNGG